MGKQKKSKWAAYTTARALAAEAQVQLVTVYQWIYRHKLQGVVRRGVGATSPWMIPKAEARRFLAKRARRVVAKNKERALNYQDDGRFGLFIQQRRKRLKFSQSGLSRICKLSVSYISKLEAGQRRPTIRTVRLLAPALGLRVKALLETLTGKPEVC